jgi:hypothetical protein
MSAAAITNFLTSGWCWIIPSFTIHLNANLVRLELDRSLHLVNKRPDFHTFAPGIPHPRGYCRVTPNHLNR